MNVQQIIAAINDIGTRLTRLENGMKNQGQVTIKNSKELALLKDELSKLTDPVDNTEPDEESDNGVVAVDA